MEVEKMPRALEEKLNHIWNNDIRKMEFRNPLIKQAYEKLNTIRLLTQILLERYKDEQCRQARAEKKRLVFSNNLNILDNKSGELVILSEKLIQLFSRKRLYVNLKNLPIFVYLKVLPVFWVNNEFLVAWNFYFDEEKTCLLLKEIEKFGDKIASFNRVEYSSWNFIESYESLNENNVIDVDLLEEKSKRKVEVLQKYLSKNIWLIPDKNIKEASSFAIYLFSAGVILPTVPYRIVFKLEKILKKRRIHFFNKKEMFLECEITYITSDFRFLRDKIYIPEKLFEIKRIEKNLIYNGLLFSFIDFEREWIYPVLFSFYEEDMGSYELFQELFLMRIRQNYFNTNSKLKISDNPEEIFEQVFSFARFLFRKGFIKTEEAFLRLDKKHIMDMVLNGLSPMILFGENNKEVFYVPLLLALLEENNRKISNTVGLLENFLIKESCLGIDEKNRLFFETSVNICDELNINIKSSMALIRTNIQRMLFMEYIREVNNRLVNGK